METKPRRYRLPGRAGPFALFVAAPGVIERLEVEGGEPVAYVQSGWKNDTWMPEDIRLRCLFVQAGSDTPLGFVGELAGSVSFAGGHVSLSLYAIEDAKARELEEAAALEARRAKAKAEVEATLETIAAVPGGQLPPPNEPADDAEHEE